ncbi:MAG: DUF1349 domain-containing protein [Candidatus Promineofilum sp.]|nr:DUF1349 domain-containing protein [Promineifilum sp.]
MDHKQFTGGCIEPGVNSEPNGNVWYSEPDTLVKCPKTMTLTIPDGIAGALRAEIFVDLWRNYDTHSARLRLNNNPNKVYESPVGYDWSRTPWVQEVPLNELHAGDNTFLFWGESGRYHIHDVSVRIYFDAGHPLVAGGSNPDVDPPEGQLQTIRSLDSTGTDIPAADGGVLDVSASNKIKLTAKVSNAKYVEFHAYYDGYDDDNDGVGQDWHSVSRNNWWPKGKLSDGINPHPDNGTINHIGTVTFPNPNLVDQTVTMEWNVAHIVNQSGVKFKIRVIDQNGNAREAAGGVSGDFTLIRKYPVVYYTIPNFDDFGLHMDGNRPDTATYNFPLPDDLNLGAYRTAYLVGMYWRTPLFSWNGSKSATVRGDNQPDSWELQVRDIGKSSLKPGSNSLTFLWKNGQGNFIEYPGPMLVLVGNNQSDADISPPNVVGRTPAAGSTNIDRFAPVSIRVKDSGVGIDSATILMSVNNQQVTPKVSGPSNDLTVTFTPTVPYPSNETIPVTFYACDLVGNCMSTSDTFSFTTEPPDLTPPVISNVVVNTTSTSATVTWLTDESATSKVEYGLTTAYDMPPVSDAALVTNHSLQLDGLTPGTTYNFRLTSTDYFTNTAVSGNLTFKTKLTAGAIQSDGFSSCELNTTVWSYINPLSDAPLTLTGAGAQIAVPGGLSHDLWKQGLLAPRLMQFVTNQDFDIEVKFASTLASKTQTMGILVQQDSSNWLRVNFQNDGLGANSLVVVDTKNGNAAVVSTTPITIGAANYMRLNRAGDLWNLQYSTDGTNWTFAATITRALTMSQIGAFVGNTGSNPAFTGVVDYFINLGQPISKVDPPLSLNVTKVGVGTVTPVPDKVNYLCNETVQVTAAPAADWVFQGWSGAVNSTDPTVFLVMTKAQDLVATFTNSTLYTMNVNVVSNGDGTGGTVSKNPNAASYLYGTEIALTAAPTAGWSFTGWSGDWTGTELTPTVPITGNMDITATFDEDEYTIETLILADGIGEGGSISVTPFQPTYKYGDIVTLTVTVNPGWAFLGWEGEGVSGTNMTLTFPMTQDVAAVAHLEQSQYDLDVTITNNGVGDLIDNAVILLPEQDKYGYGQEVTLAAAPVLGWEFSGWSGAINSTALTETLTITQDNAVTATFTQETYDLTVTTDGPGSVEITPLKDAYVYGDVVTLTPKPEKGYDFITWTGDIVRTDAPLIMAIEKDTQLEAVFEVDTTPIEILNYDIEVHGGTVAVVSWTTDVPGTSRVDYGETAFYEGGTEAKDDLVTSHKLTLSGLTAETFYHLQIISTDADGNEVQTPDLTFSTSISSGLASDDFSSCELSDRWKWVDPLGDGAHGVTGHQVEISVPAGKAADAHNIWTTGIDVPRLMQPSNNTDFTIEVKFDSTLSGLVAMQGVLVQQDEQNFIRFDFYKRSPENEPQQVTVYAATFQNLLPVVRTQSNNKVDEQLKPIYMRIVREGNKWTQFYSYNGEDWTENVSFTFEMVVKQVGIYAGNTPYKGNVPAHTAVVDYFFNSASPIVPEDSYYKPVAQIEGSGKVQFTPDKDGYYCGEEVTVTAVPSNGWSFAGWEGDITGSGATRTFIVDEQHLNFIARFRQGDYKTFMPFVQKP